MIKEINLFDAIKNIKNLADCYITIGDVIELKIFLHNSLINYISSIYNKAPKYTRSTISNINEISNDILMTSLFPYPHLFIIEQMEKLDAKSLSKSKSKANNINYFFEKLTLKPKEHLIIFDYQFPQWQWSKSTFLKQYENLFNKLNCQIIPCFDESEYNLPNWIKSFCFINNYDIENEAIKYITDYI